MSRVRKSNSQIKCVISLINLGIMVLLYAIGWDIQKPFVLFTVLTYAVVLPRKLINPKNIVFAYYFVWYCLCPLYANRYVEMNEKFGGKRVNTAFIMCFITYSAIMITLEALLWNVEKKDEGVISRIKIKKILLRFRSSLDKTEENGKQKMNITARIVMFILFFLGLALYIRGTGGLYFWITNPNDAFFSRSGSGMFYLMFTNSLFILLYFEGQRSLNGILGYVRRLFYIGLFFGSYIFIGSRSTTFMMLLILFSNAVIALNLFDLKSILLMLTGAAIFVIGMYVRVGTEVMNSMATSISSILNYFDTFENLLIMLRDFDPSFGKTFFLPFNWLFIKLGTYIKVPFYDMSIWLTTVYYPDSWLNGGTTQWPIEADMYFSFYFIGGIPFVVAYFAIIAYIYKKAQKKSVWRYIYIVEGFYIFSHLRGGILIFWYYWLIPIYIILLHKYDDGTKIKFKFGRT